MKTMEDKSICPLWGGHRLFEALDFFEVPTRDRKGPFRMPIHFKFKANETVVLGKVASGSVHEGDSLFIMPKKDLVTVNRIFLGRKRVKRAGAGKNLRIRISGVEEEDILAGFVLSSVERSIAVVTEFVAQLQILELLENDTLSAGYKAVLHIHSIDEECEIVELLELIVDPKTKEPMKKTIPFAKKGAVVMCRIQVNNRICIEKFSDFPQLGRFTLSTEGKTVALGKVTDF